MSQDELRKDGVFVVIERHHVSPEWVVGVAASLDGARSLVLDAGDFELLVPTSDPDEYAAVKVDSSSPEAVKEFRWSDPSAIGKWAGTFKLGDGVMVAEFQGQESSFYVHWTMFRD